MKRGTENPESNPEGYVISHILGRNAAEMVAVFPVARTNGITTHE